MLLWPGDWFIRQVNFKCGMAFKTGVYRAKTSKGSGNQCTKLGAEWSKVKMRLDRVFNKWCPGIFSVVPRRKLSGRWLKMSGEESKNLIQRFYRLTQFKVFVIFCFQVASESRSVSCRIALWAWLGDEFLTQSPVQPRNSQSERR